MGHDHTKLHINKRQDPPSVSSEEVSYLIGDLGGRLCGLAFGGSLQPSSPVGLLFFSCALGQREVTAACVPCPSLKVFPSFPSSWIVILYIVC